MRNLARGLIAAIVFSGASSTLTAQSYFGQNQVQYDHFDWKILETEHFLVHYYPEMADVITDAARMAERSYARLSRLLKHEFREKKPLILFRSRTDFGQNNVLGDLGEGTGGVTEALRHRVLMPFTGDFQSFEHVLAHELVHSFQYDIFARGRAGAGLQTLQQVQPPLWMMEGMAEYLSLGPGHVLTQSWMRDAALNGNLPTIEQMTMQPGQFFPYRFGEALWEYIGGRWGDDVIGEILNAVPNVGVERAFKREIGLSLEELSDEWREAMQAKHLPQVGTLDRARKIAQPLLNQRKSGGIQQLFVAPALSPDGKYIAFISTGSYLKGEVFPDLWLADGETGKRIKRLIKSTTDPDFEELRLLYSQSSFSPDGQSLAFTAQRNGKDVLYVMDMKSRKVRKTFDAFPLDVVTNPGWSPDGTQIVMSGYNSGIHDLFVVDVADGKLRRLTNDKHAELMPQWSPDGKLIAFATDRADGTDLDVLRFTKWQIATLELSTGNITTLPNQKGLNLNPQWAPDGKSVAFISDRNGTANIFLYDFDAKEHYQLTNLVGSVSSFAEYSPAITWARGADRLAFTNFEDGDYTVWSTANPRRLKGKPYQDPVKPLVVAAGADAPPVRLSNPATTADNAESMRRAVENAARALGDTAGITERSVSVYRAQTGIRPSAEPPGLSERSGNAPLTVAALLDSAAFALPDTTTFRSYDYKPGFQAEYIARPSVGVQQDNFGQGVFGQTALVFGDMVGNNRLIVAGAINGRISDASLYVAYGNFGHRTQLTTGINQSPFFILTDARREFDPNNPARAIEDIDITRFVVRQGFAVASRPINRFTRYEFGLTATNLANSLVTYSRLVDYSFGIAGDYQASSVTNLSSVSYVAPSAAYVSDNTLFGYTAPITGRRFRFQVEQNLGQLQWTDFTADYRRYMPILFNFLTFAWRVQSNVSVGRDETYFPKYLGRPDFIRGYDREQFSSQFCGGLVNNQSSCGATELVGSRTAIANAELRFPLVRRFDLGLIPIGLPPVDGLVFYDAGLAWQKGQSVSATRPAGYDQTTQRYPLRSWGAGIRLNLFGFALLRWDYAIALDRPKVNGKRQGYWMWTLGQSF